MTSFQVTVSPVVNAITVSDSAPSVSVNGVVTTATGSAGGDLSGSYPSPVVDGIQGRGVASTAPTNGQALAWNNSTQQWEPTSISAGSGTVTSITAGTGLTGGTITTSGTIAVDFGTGATQAAPGNHTHAVGDISGLGTMAVLGSTAGGDLSGTWPTITVDKVQGNVFSGGTPADGELWMYQTGANRWTLTSFADVLAYNNIGWDGTTLTVDAIATDSITFPTFGESITNPVNGRIDFTPAPSASTAWKLYVDMTSFNVGVRLGVIRTSDSAANPAGSYIVFDTTAQIATDKSLSFHSNDWMQLRGTSTGNDTAQLCVRSNFAGSSGAFALIDLTQLGTATRSPATAHVDPTFYVYSNDITEANDFVRVSHNRTDGVIESGNGDLRLVSQSGVVRANGAALISEEDAIAFAAAL